MKLTPAKIGLLVVALAGVVTGSWLGISAMLTKKRAAVSVQVPDSGQRERAPVPTVRFTDVTEKAGIQFRHTNGAFGMKLLPETMGSGVAILDFDNDGKPDILFVNSRPWPGDKSSEPVPTMKLYRNKGDGTFEDVTEKMGLAIPLYGMGVTLGDFNNDGWTDIYITAIGGNKLFRNDGGKRFVDVTEEAGVGDGGLWPNISREEFLKLDKPMPWPTAATFVDYDGDGKLDLFVCRYVTWSPAYDLANDFQLKDAGRAYGPPTAFEGTQCTLYRNIDGKHFEDVSEKVGLRVVDREGVNAKARNVAKSLGLIICDPDQSGWPSLMVANDTERNFFFHNVPTPYGERRFQEIGLRSGVSYAESRARGGMGIDWGEFRPGQWSVVIANFANEPCTFLTQDKAQGLGFSDSAFAVGLTGPTRGPLKFGTF
ncbi:MAG TPA: VCBS repeat-containing protein, partial [Gemmataceae bacterium]|nr:VCBS repeat-containing protein [Gemmataceae bacterium]